MADVRLSQRALADLRAIHRYLAERNPVGAGKVVAAIEHSLLLIAEQPMLGRAEERGYGRLHIVPRYGYVISYRIEGEEVEVRYILHPRRSR